MLFRQLFDAASSTYSYLLADEGTREAVLIDPVLPQLERDVTLVAELGLKLVYAIDTHVHADHVTATGALRERLGCKTVVSARTKVDCADVRVHQGDVITFGAHQLRVAETPGHTDGCVSYVLAEPAMVFTGDALLIRGCGRTDFQQGDSRRLYRSVHEQLFSLPPETTVYPAHDYKGRTATSVGEEQAFNLRLGAGKTEDEFVAIMSELQLAYPAQIDIALPRNLHCGVAVQAADPQLVSGWYPIMSAAGIPEVTPAWVAQHTAGLHLVDVREPAELTGELGHIVGIDAVPLATLATAAITLDGRPVVTVCRSGGRSGTAIGLLRQRGIEPVASMAGGMLAWQAAQLPVER